MNLDRSSGMTSQIPFKIIVDEFSLCSVPVVHATPSLANMTGENVWSLYLYMAEGSMAIMLNLPLAIAMLATPNIRRRREFQVIIGISLTDTVFGLAFVMSATSRLDIVANSINTGIPLIPRWVCARRIYVNLITMAYQLQGTLSLAVAIDRLLAVSIPFRYLKFGRKYNTILATGPYLLVAAGTITNFCTTYRDETLVSSFCLTLNALTPQFYGYMLLLRIGCIAASALIYVVIVTRVNKQFTRMEKSQVRIVGQSHQFRNIRSTTATVGLSTALAVIFLLIPDVIKYFDIFGLQTNYITLLYSLSMAHVDFNILIVAFRHKEIIASLKRIIYSVLRRDIVDLPPKVFAATTISRKVHSKVYNSSVHFSK